MLQNVMSFAPYPKTVEIKIKFVIINDDISNGDLNIIRQMTSSQDNCPNLKDLKWLCCSVIINKHALYLDLCYVSIHSLLQ